MKKIQPRGVSKSNSFCVRLRRGNRRVWLSRAVLCGLCYLVGALSGWGQNVITYQYDNGRTGQNTTETTLTPANVNVSQFGKLFSVATDGKVYAQPLYAPNIAIAGKGTHNVLIVTTEKDSVYAFDADTGGRPLWQISLVDAAHGAGAGETAVNSGTIACTDMQPLIGSASTPVIDTGTGTIYVEAKSTISGSAYFHRLHALDITSGAEKSPGPVGITATVSGTGSGSSGGQLPFDGKHQLNRPGLLLMNGTIFLGYASHCDHAPYHGWLFAYDEATLTQKSVFVTTPNGGQGGIWMSGAGLASDTNANIFVSTGNGTFSQGTPLELGDSILKLNFANGTLSLLDYFTPYNQSSMNSGDFDLGSGGVLLLPTQPGSNPNLLVQAGKQGTIYLLNRDKLTTNPSNTSQEEPYCSGCGSDPQIVQEVPGAMDGMFSMPAYFNGATYWLASDESLKSIPLSNGLLDIGHMTSATGLFAFPGATPSISANGTSDGIVWAIDSSQYGFPGPGPGPAVLHAYNAANVSEELWNSTQAAGNRDQAGNAVKFTVPRIANGKVYIGTSTGVFAYGLLGTPQAALPVISPAAGTYVNSVNVTITDATPGATITYTTDGTTPVPGSQGTAIASGGSFTLTSSATVQAVLSATGSTNSSLASAAYTVTTSTPLINFGGGFAGETTLTLNGGAIVSGTRLRLTDGGTTEARSAFVTSTANVQSFTNDFSFQLTAPHADGFTFTIQGSSVNALGPAGGGLGYGPGTTTGTGGIPKSLAVKFDFYNNAGEGAHSTGLYTNGASPTVPSTDMTASGVNLLSGDVMNVHMTYDGTTLTWTITDPTSGKTFTTSVAVNIPSIVGGNTAWVGFTAGTGGLTATQDILFWTYTPG